MSYSITQSHLIPMVYIGIDTHSTNYTMSAVVRQFLPSGKFQLIDLMPTRMKAPKLENVLQYIKDCRVAFGQKECNIICGYEAGAFGYVLYRQLMAKDIPCVVMAPTSLVKSSREKNSRMIALMPMHWLRLWQTRTILQFMSLMKTTKL